ncbi:hypothetical protein E1B28_008674 [Marasmius oreades]|uniref:Shr3 amino acid permease chaperone n=1 Tax=Marasmius oreades TaxID=181124 RepID=A0A9P7US01_9AGAR|nr:uncharacterized protein E1B28_008674 [Marasmius oreades]KAG7092312.1 hypothetical protein E1B28_008674 [Marasmius oreades]
MPTCSLAPDKMGVRAAVVVSVTSFLLGSLFTHWIADSITLWKSPTNDDTNFWIAASYYTILTKFPQQLSYALAAIIVLGGTTIIWSFNDGRAGNLMFDGGSLFLFATTLAVYTYSVIPTLRTHFTSLPPHQLNDALPQDLRAPVLDLASSHLICSVTLTGVLALQAGRFWAEKTDDEGDEEFVELDTDYKPTPSQSRSKTPNAELSDS